MANHLSEESLNRLISKNSKILVIGDLMIDDYLWGSSSRISPEAPVQVVDITSNSSTLGGAGNVINNLKSFNCEVDIYSVVGDCDISSEIKEKLSSIDVSSKYLVTEKNRKSSKKTRIVASNQQVIRYDIESVNDISAKSEEKLIRFIENNISLYDAVVISDYGKGVLTKKLSQRVIELSNKNNIKVLVDPKGEDFSKYDNAYILTPNKSEASKAIQHEISSSEELLKALKKLKTNHNLNYGLITLSEQGIAIFDNELKIFPTAAREVFDVTGAGDTVIASLAFAISSGLSIEQSIIFSNIAAGIVVGKFGSSTCNMKDIHNYLHSLSHSFSKSKLKHISSAPELVKQLRNENKSIVFTNGCFDILHAGHVTYLEEAKSYGDILIVGLNSDSSVKSLKGKSRPINNQDDRALVLSSLEVVDFVFIFENETPIDLIRVILPDILIKGGDYKGKKVVGEEYSKELKIVEFLEGRSSTNTINKIIKSC